MIWHSGNKDKFIVSQRVYSASFCLSHWNLSFSSLWRTFGPLFFAELLWFSHTGAFLSVNDLFMVVPKHINWIWVQTLFRSLLLFVFLSHSEAGLQLAGVSLSSCTSQVCLCFREQTGDGRSPPGFAEFLVPLIKAGYAGPKAAMMLFL